MFKSGGHSEAKQTKAVPGNSKNLFFQPKLTINQPNDIYEQEADAISDRIIGMAGNEHIRQPFFKPPISPVQRKCTNCEEEEKVQMKGDCRTGGGMIATQVVHNAINTGGHPLDAGTRSFMESGFGYDFGNVQVHNDPAAHQSAAEIKALAYSHGNHVVFGEGQYQPNTDNGKKLLAHELTHVVQQSSTAPEIHRKELTAAEKLADCMKQTDDILPGHVGLLTHIDRSLMLEEMFGLELPAIITKIKADTSARRFICEYGISGIAALVETQKAGSFDIPAAKAAVDESVKTKSGRFNRKAMGNWRVAEQRQSDIREEAGSIGSWAKDEDRAKEDIPSPSAALNMPAAQVTDITLMINNLELIKTNYGSAGTLLTDTQKSLDKIQKNFADATPPMITDNYGVDVNNLMTDVLTETDALNKLFFRISAGRMSLSSLRTGVAAINTATEAIKEKAMAELRKVLKGDSPDYGDMKDLIRETRTKTLKTIREGFTVIKAKIESIIKTLPKLLFVLNYFRALNDTKSTAPTEADMNLFNGQLDSIETSLFFGEGPVNPGLEIIQSVIDFVKKQVAVRLQMKSATGNLPGLIPSLAEVEAFFITMNNRTTTNQTVRQAYEDFAQAYFQHRGEVTMQDLNIAGIGDVFSLPTSITGSRSIVCGAYAQMGAALMSRAGATRITFTLAVRASREQIQNNSIDSGHAIVRLTRLGGTFFISNYLTKDTEAEAMDVAWKNPDFPLIRESAANYNDALRALENRLARMR